ncbi:Ca2+-binding RTX toxin-like protein [Rhodanobacter sp. K2T2]|uniref:calcium-binding protein n=1 Tax=Rhodanobacter sp. K2T2 TaxID=2723085 RepID=UPI0015C6C8B2|nr:calcium-binding protein [Rhodanobacter sp. K2T2]NYE30615.1 Ca2+-binding RTX toxin-like protein [Rhodanobacter sp. K2T2]
MITEIDDLNGLDALIHQGENGLYNHTPYSMAMQAPAAQSATAAANPGALQGISLENMIGLSAVVYGSGTGTNGAPLPAINSAIMVNGVQYRVIDEENDASGYQGLTLFDPLSKAIIVVNRGTERTGTDIWTDAEMAFTNTSNQWQDAQGNGAIALGSRVAALVTKFGATAVYTTGHSLGGTLSEMQAAYFGWQGYTFNAYGANEIYSQLGLAVSPLAHIVNYRTMFDLVSDASTHIGDAPITIETPADAQLLSSFLVEALVAPGNALGAFLSTVGGDHGIGNFHSANDPTGGVLNGTDNVFTLANGFSFTPAAQTQALAADVVAGMGELIHLFLEARFLISFPSGNLTAQQSAQEVLQFIDNEPLSSVKAIVPTDPDRLAKALDPATANNAYRASLVALSPAVLQGLDSSSFANASLWAPGQTTGLSRNYLIARNDMVQAIITLAATGIQGGVATTTDFNTYVYSDLSKQATPLYTLNGKGGNTYDIVFGDDKGDDLSVAAGVVGELFGGAGNDTLFGGTTDDTLEGGAGYDDYFINGAGTGIDSILDTDGKGSIIWKYANGNDEILTGGSAQAGGSEWKSADGTITYTEGFAADGSTELKIAANNKIALIDGFINGEFGITLSDATPAPVGSSNLSQLRDEGITGNTNIPGDAKHAYINDVGNGVASIYGADSSGSGIGNEIFGEGNASYIYAGNGNNLVLLGDYYYHATDPLVTPMSATIQGGTGDQQLVGVGNGTETISGGAAGNDTTAITFIDGGGATALLQGGGQNSIIFGGTGANTLVASTASSASKPGFNPFTIELAGLSFWGNTYLDTKGRPYDTTSLPSVTGVENSPDNVQIYISLYQPDGTYAAAIGLLGSSMDSGAQDTASALPGSELIGGTGHDSLIGNSGNDTIIGGQPTNPVNHVLDELLVGGAGADVIYGGGGTEIIYADLGPGNSTGWASLDASDADTIYGGSGTDFIYGSGGNDLIYGGSGTNVIHVGNGNSYVDMGSGTSSVYGGSGNDTIIADGATGYIQTGTGTSYVEVTNGASSIVGGTGTDTVQAGAGTALVTEGTGATTLIVGASTGSDTIQSGSGGTTVQLTDGLTETTLVVRDVNGDLVLSDPGFAAQITIDGYFNSPAGVALQFADGTTWSAAAILQASITPSADGSNDTLIGSNGSDSITAGFGDTSIVGVSGNNTLTGGAGNDTIEGGSGADTIEGGSGTTQIVGGTGSENYVFNLGDGSDTIQENVTIAGSDVLRLGAGISASDLSFTYNSASNMMQIGFGSASDSTMTIANFMATQTSQHQLTKLVFADGTFLSQQQMIQQGETIDGTTGNDTLTGNTGTNYFDGKGGNDDEIGNGGADTFIFDADYGDLNIEEPVDGSNSVLQLGAGITASALHVATTGGDEVNPGAYRSSLVLTDGISGDQITLEYAFPSNGYGVNEVAFADGTTLTRNQLIQLAMIGTSGNDTINGTSPGGASVSGADLIDGKGGNDVEIGNGGSDTFVFNAGYGQLEINEYLGGQQSVLQLGAGINAPALRVTSDGYNLFLTDGIAGDRVELDGMWEGNANPNSVANGYGVAMVQLADGTTLTAAQLISMGLTGTTGNDSIYGTSVADYRTAGADLIDGKGGNDVVNGNGGNDTFVFDSGYGQLVIRNSFASGDQPVLKLGQGITASTLHAATNGTDLILTDGIAGDQITLAAMLASSDVGVASVQLADGTLFTAAQLIQMATHITGTTGNDTLQGGAAAEQIDGKGGNDSVTGGGGNDTFAFNSGYGDLEINEAFKSGQVPVLQLGAGITASSLHAIKSGNNLVLTDGVSGDQVTLDGMWATATDGVASAQLSDGTTLTRAQLIALEMTGTTGADTITGTSSADMIDGKGGNDSVVGSGGNDTFVFNSGYGHLEINEVYTGSQQPVLQFGAGITASSLHVTESANNLIVADGVAGDQITLDKMWSTSTDGIGEVTFANGTTLTRAQLIQMEMTGTTGADTITGTSGADLIDGKGGNDSVVGSGGNDTFVFNSGYGHLQINEVYTSGQTPILQLGAGITSSALKVAKSGNNLVLTDGVSGDQITFNNMWTTATDGVAKVTLANGTSLTRSQLITLGTPAATKPVAQSKAMSTSADPIPVNTLIHAMASYGGSDPAAITTSPTLNPATPDLLLHVAA